MGKGAKANQQKPSHLNPSPQPSEQHVSEIESSEIQDHPIENNDEQILERINEEIVNNFDPLKLTWAAIHKLKQEEKIINDQMDLEMKQIQLKYDLLRMPVIHKIAKAASGIPLEKQIYTHHDLTKSICVNKNKPQPVPGYWRGVFTSISFSLCEEDDEILDKCTRFECMTNIKGEGETAIETVKLTFELEENQIISNKQLCLEVEKKGGVATIKSSTNLNFKAYVPDNSSLEELFNEEAEPERVFSMCQDLQRAYNNSIFYYLYEGTLDGQGLGNQEEDDEQQEQQEQQEPAKKSGKGKSKGHN